MQSLLKRSSIAVVLIAIATVASVPSARGQVTSVVDSVLSESRIRAIATSVETWREEHGVPGISIAVGVENQLAFARGFGESDVENHVPVTVETRFRTASIAKPITAALIVSLFEEGSLNLDDDILTWCPDYGEKQWPVTVRQLLGHLGGVRHYKYPGESSSTEHCFSLDEALALFADDPLLHEPGSRYYYTTFGYNLLGSVAEGAGGEPFMSLLEKHVLGPAEMKDTFADNTFQVIEHRARGYIRPSEELLAELPDGHGIQAGELYNSLLHDTSMKIPGGGLVSTPSDLVRFASALNEGVLVSTESRDAMWTSMATNSGTETGYGMGWRISQRAGRKAVSHTGGQSGTSTVLVLFSESGVSVAVMSNLEDMQLTGLAESIAKSVFEDATNPSD